MNKGCEGCRFQIEPVPVKCFGCSRAYHDLYVGKKGYEIWVSRGMKWPSRIPALDNEPVYDYPSAVVFPYPRNTKQGEIT